MYPPIGLGPSIETRRRHRRLQLLPTAGKFNLGVRGLVEQDESTEVSNLLRYERPEFVLVRRPDLPCLHPRWPAKRLRALQRDARPIPGRYKDGMVEFNCGVGT
jgi:hypothetical protein